MPNSAETSFNLKTNSEDTLTTVIIILLALLLYIIIIIIIIVQSSCREHGLADWSSARERERVGEKGSNLSTYLQCDILPVRKTVPQITNAWLFRRILNVNKQAKQTIVNIFICVILVFVYYID